MFSSQPDWIDIYACHNQCYERVDNGFQYDNGGQKYMPDRATNKETNYQTMMVSQTDSTAGITTASVALMHFTS